MSSTASYDAIAREYYDAKLHPTCANFNDASSQLLARLVPAVDPGRACEVGAGRSSLASIFAQRGAALSGLRVSDASVAMLEHAAPWRRKGVQLIVAPAQELPIADHSLDVVVASLLDPYDDERSWQEFRRVLAPGGVCIVTAPSWTWASRYRPAGARHDAIFELANGEVVNVPSMIRPSTEQRSLLMAAGFALHMEDEVRLCDLREPVSPKLRVLDPHDPVVRGYVACAGSDARASSAANRLAEASGVNAVVSSSRTGGSPGRGC